MTKTGQRLVPVRGNRLNGFTAYKSYEVIAGTGEQNLSPAAISLGTCLVHSETSANVRDDAGNIRFVTLTYFRDFGGELGTLFTNAKHSSH